MCGNCMYCVPMLTPRGMHTVCLNPDSDRLYQSVGVDDVCVEYVYENDPALMEVEDEENADCACGVHGDGNTCTCG